MKSKILAIYSIFLLPILYFYNEVIATTLTALLSSGFAIGYLLDQKKQKLVPTKLLTILLFLLTIWLFTVGRSVVISCASYASFPVFIKLCSLLLLTYSVTCELSHNPKESITFYRAAAFTGFFQGLFAIAEYIEAPPIPATWLDPASKELFRTRCCGMMTDPNIFAAFLSALFIMTIGLIITSDKKNEQSGAASSLVLCGTGIFMTLSRGGWIALFAGLTAFFVALRISGKKPSEFANKILFASAVILLIVFFAGPFRHRLFSITKPTDMTFAQRTLINKGIFGAIDRLPIAGHGIHTFTQVYPLYRIVGGDYPMNAHNEFLHSLIETGFFSSLLLALITVYIFRIAYKGSNQHNLDCIIFFAVFISFLIQNLSGFSTRILPTSILIAIAVAGTIANQLIKSPFKYVTNKTSQLTLCNYAIAALTAVVICGSAYSFVIQTRLSSAPMLMKAGKINEGIQALEYVLRCQPGNTNAADALGMYELIMRKNQQKAVEIWQKAIKYNPCEPILQLRLATCMAESDPETADAYYQQVLKLDPASEEYRLNYARFLLNQNKKAEAKTILEKGLTYSPGFHNVYTGFQRMENLLEEIKSTN